MVETIETGDEDSIIDSIKINDKTQKLYVIQEHGFKDNDYESNSQMINRIKGFSFVRDGPDFV